jgi:hypothetical protein
MLTYARNAESLPSLERLQAALVYCPETGRIRNRISRGNRAIKGRLVGCINANGYRTFCLDGQRLLCSRVAWALHYGRWPEHEIGHIDGNRANDAIANLIDAPRSIHHANSVKPNVDSRSPALGVRRRSHSKKVQAFFNGRCLGYYATVEEAQKRVWDYKRDMGLVYRPDELLPV